MASRKLIHRCGRPPHPGSFSWPLGQNLISFAGLIFTVVRGVLKHIEDTNGNLGSLVLGLPFIPLNFGLIIYLVGSLAFNLFTLRFRRPLSSVIGIYISLAAIWASSPLRIIGF